MKTKHRKLIILLFLLCCLLLSEGTTLLSNFTNTFNNESPIYEQKINSSANNYYFIDGITVTGYSFDAKFECYIITELSGIDSTTFELDSKIYDVSYGLNIIPINFGNSTSLHSLIFEQNDVDDQNFNWFAVQSLIIEHNETIVSIDDTFTTSFFASGTVAILVQPSFSYNWLYLELDGNVINDVYDPNYYPEIDSTLFSYFIEDGSYLSFIFHLEPQEHVLNIRGNGSLNYKIISNYDWDEDLIYDVEEVQKEFSLKEKLDPTVPNVWGYFAKSNEIAQFDDISGIGVGCFHFYIPESYDGARFLYLFSNRGTISDIVIDDDFLTLEGFTLSEDNKNTPYGYLAKGHHTLNYRYYFNETTEIKMQIGGRDIIILDKIEYKDTDGDGVRDNQERSMGSDKDLIDTDFDGLPDNVDSSPLTLMILDRDEYQDFYIPANIDKNTVITMRIKKPNPDYTALEERIYLDNHYHGPGINVSIYPVIDVIGNYSGIFDPVPDLEDLNASRMYIYAEITDDAFEFKLNYGKGHPGKEDGEIDLRFFFRWMVFYNDSGSTNFLRQYNFDQDILVQSMIVEEVDNVNYILGTPDSMIEHQILWALTQNPMLGTPTDFDVNDDIVGIGTMDYLDIANQTCIDYENAHLNGNETVVLYVAGVQNNYDFLNKLSLESIVDPSFEVNHSGEFASYSTFCSINDPNKKKSNLQQFLSKKCYEISWNNLSTETTNIYEQRANLQGIPIKMETFLLQNSRILKLTQAIGTQIPLSDIPFTLEPTINEKIAFLNQTYLEPIEGDQISPELLFNESKHILYETLDTHQMNVEDSELIFKAEGIPLSEKFATFLGRLKIMSEGLENTINLFPELGINLDFEILWDEEVSLQERFSGIDIFFDQIYTGFTPEDFDIFKEITDSASGIDDALGFADGVEALIEPTTSLKNLKTFGTTSWDLSRFFKTKQVGLGIFSTFLGYYQVISQINEMYDMLTNIEDYDLANFTSGMTIAIGKTILGVLAVANGAISIAIAFSSYAVSEALLSMAGSLAIVSTVIFIAIEAIDAMTSIAEEFTKHGISAGMEQFKIEIFDAMFPLFSYETLSILAETNRLELLIFYLVTPYFADMIIRFFLHEPPQEEIYPSLEIVWEDPEGDPASFIIYPHRDTWFGNSLTDGDVLEFQMTFHNNGTVPLEVVSYIGIPSDDGTVVFEWPEIIYVDVDETDVINHIRGIGVFSPSLIVCWNLQIKLSDNTEIYNSIIEVQCGMPVCPDNIADFYSLTDKINKTYNEQKKSIEINDHPPLELDPAIGVVPINLSLDIEGYADNLVTFNISCEDTNFYVDTPIILQNLYTNINFNLYSQDVNFLGGIYYFTLDIINGTGTTIFSNEIAFRLSFMRDLSYSQTNVIFEEKLYQVLDWNNITTPINIPATTVEIGDVMFAKFITNSTKKINISLLFDAQIMVTYQIKARGKLDDLTQFVEILIDKDFTFNNFYLEGELSNTDYLMITDLIVIDASIKTTSDVIFNPINFTNNGNVPEFVKFSFSGILFDNVDTKLYQNEFEGKNQYAIIIEGEERTCLFNTSNPVNPISNLYFRSITASDPIFKHTYCKHFDNLEIEGIYINNPINTTHNQYLREDTLMISIIPQEDLEWSSYSLDDQPTVNFSHSVYIPFPQEGTHKIQVFGENSFSELFESEIRYFIIKSMMIDIKSPVSEFYSEPDLGFIYNASYGFDYDINGTSPSGLESSDNVNVINFMDDHIKVVELGNLYEHLSCLEGDSRAYGTIEFWIRFGDLDHSSYSIAFSDSVTDNFLIFISTSDDTWHYYPDYQTSLQIPNVANPQSNIWHHVRIDFRCNGAPAYLGLSEEYFTITIDGISSGPLDFYYTGFNEVGSIKIGTGQYNAKEGKLWIDAIGCSWDTEYAIGDNLGGIKRYAIPLIYDSEVYFKSLNYTIDSDYSTPLKTKDLALFSENSTQTYELYGIDLFGDPYESNLVNLALKKINLFTPSGTNVMINDPFTGISLNFTNVVSSGNTSISFLTNETIPAFPSTIEINSHYYPTYILSTQFYEVTSSAEFYDPMTITFPYPENRVQHNERNIELFRYEYGWWHNITQNLNLDQNEINGIISRLSYFVVVEIIDNLAPQTHLLINGSYPRQFNEYTHDLFIELNVYEDFRVAETLYSLDGIYWISYTEPFVIDEEFNSHFEYYSIDDSNNSELIKWRGVLLDKSPPITEIIINPNITDSSGNVYYLEESTLSFIVNDISTYIYTYYRIENTPYSEFRLYSGPVEITNVDTWTIHFYSTDQMGHVEEIQTITISSYNTPSDFLPIIIGSSIVGTAGVAVLLTVLFLRKRRIKSPTKT